MVLGTICRLAKRPNLKGYAFTRNYTHFSFAPKKRDYFSNYFVLISGVGLLGCFAAICSPNVQNNASTHGHDFINSDTIPIVQQAELSLHNKPGDCWVSIHGHVYDVTEFLEAHPGGADKLLRFAGKDATRSFRLQHPEGHLERYLGEEAYRGELLVPKKEKATKKVKEKKEKLEKVEKEEKQDASERHERDRKSSRPEVTEIDELGEYYENIIYDHLKKENKKSSKKSKNVKANDNVKQTYSIENKPSLDQIFSMNDFEYVAQKILPDLVYTYLQTGSDNEFSRYEDRAALCRIFFRPKCLVDVRVLELTSQVLGAEAGMPFLVGAFPGSGLIQAEGETVVVRSACDRNILQIIPKDSDSSLEEIMKMSKGKDVFYQYSIDSREEFDASANVLNELKTQFPNIRGFFIDVESSISGNLEHYKKVEASRHQMEEHPAPQLRPKSETEDFRLCWADLQKLKREVDAPIVLKGIQRSEDVVKSRELGFRGVLISNHEGKQLDQGQSSIEILHEARRRLGETSDFHVFVEGGFRRGSDLVKALCLGGTPVVSKPILFSEVYGEAGVEKALDILSREVATTMRLIGAKSVSELSGEFVDCESLRFKATAVRNLDAMYDANYTEMPVPPFENQTTLRMI
ncbi:hypothetical protein PMKS-000677 [Pichia membranifaciens]|uniref:Cytochrome b2 n=1 Tax=Pichia membranifaciens TaxID=4926 RepID=A0A1Q2YCT9_9ASCO|nr:hypothetical protein PMKS-000677 [Pichia membranifaciens]